MLAAGFGSFPISQTVSFVLTALTVQRAEKTKGPVRYLITDKVPEVEQQQEACCDSVWFSVSLCLGSCFPFTCHSN